MYNLLVHSGNDEHRIEDCVGGQSRPDEPREEDGEGEEDTFVLLVLHRRRPVDLTFASICKKNNIKFLFVRTLVCRRVRRF